MQLLKLPAWKVEDRRFAPRSSIREFKKQMFLPRSLAKIQYCGSLREQEVAYSVSDRLEFPVSGGECHLIYPTILMRLSQPSLVYMCTKVA